MARVCRQQLLLAAALIVFVGILAATASATDGPRRVELGRSRARHAAVVSTHTTNLAVRGATAAAGGDAATTTTTQVGVTEIEYLSRPGGSLLRSKLIDHASPAAAALLAQGAGAELNETLVGGLLVNGAYNLEITVGTPPQTFFVDVDTGSSDLLVAAAQCSCGSFTPKNTYAMSASSTAQATSCGTKPLNCTSCSSSGQCNMVDQYGSGHVVQSQVVNDVVAVGGLGAPSYFGTMLTVSGGGDGFQFVPMDGLLGMAYQALSAINAPTVFDQLVAAGQVAGDVFSMCMGGNKGAITLGGVDTALAADAIQYVPIKQELYYTIATSGFMVAGQPVGGKANSYSYLEMDAIVDSGSSDMFLPEAVVDNIYAAFRDQCHHHDMFGVCNVDHDDSLFAGNCYAMAESDLHAFPDLTLVAQPGNVYLAVPPKAYMKPIKNNGRLYYCLGIRAVQASYGQPSLLVGDTFMRAFFTVFDRQNGRLGFANVSSECPGVGYTPHGSNKPPAVFWIMIALVVCAGLACCAIFVGCMVALWKRSHRHHHHGHHGHHGYAVISSVNPA